MLVYTKRRSSWALFVTRTRVRARDREIVDLIYSKQDFFFVFLEVMDPSHELSVTGPVNRQK